MNSRGKTSLELTDATDQLAKAYQLAEAVFMASQALEPEQGEPLRLIVEALQDRLDAAKAAIAGVVVVA